MKKFFSTLIVLAVISTAMVAETKLFSVNFAIPVDTITMKLEIPGYSETQKQSFTSIGFGVSGVNMFNNIVGLYSDVEIGIAQKIKEESGSYTRKEIKDANSNFKQFSMNFMIGPAFKIIENDKMFFSAAPAFHWYMNYLSFGNAANTVSGGMIGLGANASFSYFFTDLIGITAGLDFAFDFFGYGDYKKQEYDTGYGFNVTQKCSHINFTPKVGVSFRF